MLKRNRALEEEALRAMRGEPAKASRIQVERSELAQSQKQSQAVKSKLQSEEEQILRKVLEISKKEAEEKEAIEKLEEKTFAHQLQQSKKQYQEVQPKNNQ